MKPQINNNPGISPPTSTTGAGVAKGTSLPIARSSNSAWEKPERARTSHACEPCRERKTKCDGERPSCRRCIHTGTSCHYGYGKGWRKRKTAEDLTATSRRLARYEDLLNEIIPMVSPEVRQLIEEARDQETSPSNNGSETNEVDPSLRSMLKTESSNLSSTSSRMILPLPVPSPLGGPTGRASSTGAFDPGTAAGPGGAPTLSATPQRMSPDTTPAQRLPSITPDGLLIESGARERSPPKPPHLSDATQAMHAGYGTDRSGISSTSPTSHASFGGWSHGNYPLAPLLTVGPDTMRSHLSPG